MYEESSRLKISSSNDISIDGGDDIFFKSEGTNIVHIRGDEKVELEVNGGLNVESHITASGNISGKWAY